MNERISVENQYIKDFSFENPSAPFGSLIDPSEIDVSIGLDIDINKIDKEDVYEVVLIINANAKKKEEEDIIFAVELSYAGVFTLYNFKKDQHQFVLAVSCASILFPYARKIVGDVTQSGGFQPLMIDPIDFATLYYNNLERSQSPNADF